MVAENIPGEAQEAEVKAVLAPTVLSKFYTDYKGHPIPPTEEHFVNVLEDCLASITFSGRRQLFFPINDNYS